MNTLHRVFISNNAKCWMQVAYAVSTYKIMTADITKLSTEIFLGWFAVVGSVELLKRAIAAKLEKGNGQESWRTQGLSQRLNGRIREDGPCEEVPRSVRGRNHQAQEGVVG